MSDLPYYILVAHSSLQYNSAGQSNALVHADIEYRYADDSSLSLLPRFPDEHVMVFNYDPADAVGPTISSTSSQLALTSIKVLPAPGVRAGEDTSKNNNMYILEVTSTSDDQYAGQSMVLWFFLNCPDRTGGGVESSQAYLQNPRAILARFKQRNADLRRILEYPDTHAKDHVSGPNSSPTAPSDRALMVHADKIGVL